MWIGGRHPASTTRDVGFAVHNNSVRMRDGLHELQISFFAQISRWAQYWSHIPQYFCAHPFSLRKKRR